MSVDFGRIITAMVTPFNEKLEVDYNKAVDLAKKITNEHTDTVLLAGTTGESPTLSMDEKLQLFEHVRKGLDNNIPIIAGTGSNSTKASIELSKEAEKIGVDGILLVVPYYNKPPQDALYEHFKAIADSVSIPVIIYNVPSRTVTNIEPSTVAKLALIDNIIGIKEACGNMDQISQLKQMVPKDFKIYSGDDSLTLPMLSLGGYGVVSVASQIIGKEIHEMITLFLKGEIESARKMHNKLMPIFKALFVTTNPIPVKAALKLTGFDVGSLRLPLREINDQEKQILIQSLNKLNK